MKISDNEFDVKIICILEDGWHIFSQFTEEGGPLPTVFTFEQNQDIELIGKVKETGKVHKEFDKLFGVYVTSLEDKITFTQKVKIKNPKAVLKGTFDGQICKESCILFGPEKFEIKFDGTKTEPIQNTNDSVKKKLIDTTASLIIQGINTIAKTVTTSSKFDFTFADNSCSVKAENTDKSYWWIFIAGFLGGLIALLTPCVFPMIPLTVSFFTKGGKDQKQGLKKAMIYGASIIIIYVLLGILITGIFGSDALNAMSTNIWFNLLFFVVFVVFAISFFGAFEITLPSSWANKTDSMSSKGGNLGIFFMAFTLALVSFSCTGPIIGTLLVQAATGGGPTLFNYIPLKPLLGMFGFSLALALPFTLFALFPQWLQSLPKSGGWMGTIKVILGFIELALAFKFLSTVDMTMNYGILRFEPFMLIWIIIFGAMSIYCLGIFSKSKSSNFVKGFGVLTLLFTGYLIYALINYKPINLLSGIIPPTSYNFKDKNEEKFIHFKNYDEGLAYAKEHKMPVLLDFTGFGCVNCRKIEDAVWTDEKVIEEMKKYVIISLYVDDKTALPENEWYNSSANGRERTIKTVGQKWSDFQAKHFNTNSQPQYVLLNTKEQLLNQPVAYQFSSKPENYILFLQCGLKMNEQLK
ncbi:MAG: cytochrome c biogenesis protein CcdA [Chitinophagales bacterium]